MPSTPSRRPSPILLAGLAVVAVGAIISVVVRSHISPVSTSAVTQLNDDTAAAQSPAPSSIPAESADPASSPSPSSSSTFSSASMDQGLSGVDNDLSASDAQSSSADQAPTDSDTTP